MKGFERSNGLDTALYENIPLHSDKRDGRRVVGDRDEHGRKDCSWEQAGNNMSREQGTKY